jgi:hypothetical protein
VMKVATNIVTAATAQIAAEALALLRNAGIAPELFTRAMKSNASNSTTLEMKVPLMLAGNFEPHFSVKHMLKDVRIAARLAREFSLELPVTEVSSDMLLAQLKQGRGDADYSSVAQKYFSAPQKIVKQEPRKIVEPPKPAEPVLGMREIGPIAAEPVAEIRTPEPEPAMYEVPVMAAEPVAETRSPEPEPVMNEAPPLAAEPVAETKLPEPEPALHEAPPIAAELVTETKPTESEPQLQRPALVATEPAAETKSDRPAPEVKESSSVPTESISKTKPAKLKWLEDDDEEEEEVPPGVNLSGGIRGWFSRRLSRRRY